MSKKNTAFTLAEVLITLAIIGVVAALTIPSVVNNYKKQETVTRLKKTYAALSNTTNLAIADHGPIQVWEVYKYDDTVPNTTMKGSEHFAKNYMTPYLKVSAECNGANISKCIHGAKFLNGDNMTFGSSSAYNFILNDGTMISVLPNDYLAYATGARYVNATIHIDINGLKQPNILGKDIHYFRYQVISDGNPLGKFIPDGLPASRSELTNNSSFGCKKDRTATFCTALIMYDGWQIKDDYPW